MTIIVFLIDTSASMNQRVFLGGRPTLLDVAKSAVETFVKVRQRTIDSRQDRYMLLTFEEPPANIKAGWKENLASFMSELKNLQANGLTTLSNALRHTFDVLNVNRIQHGIDTYGQGKCPFYLEPSIIVCITDGGRLSSNSGVQEELKIHGSSPGFELTREPFRWDQRLFSLVLRMNGQPSGDSGIGLVPSDNSPIDAMCEVTGGRSYAITSHRMLHQCIDSLVQKVQAGVVIHFEKYGPDPPTLVNSEGIIKNEDGEIVEILDEKQPANKQWHSVRRMIYVPRTNQKGFAGGFWPIPETYWPDPSLPTLPSRTAHPNVKFSCTSADPLVVENFPFDKYELEPSPLTQFIISRKQPTSCWQVYVQNSSRSSPVGYPFGYLKASTNLSSVNLFVMPYNYPVLLPLIDELFRLHRLKPTNEWRAQFAMYLSSMPPYYAGPLKRALLRMGAGNIAQTIPEENYLSYSVLNYLKKLKAQAKAEYDRTCNEVAVRVKTAEMNKRVTITSFKNPFDIPRHQLLDQAARLRTLFLIKASHTSAIQAESLHNMPVGQMGNYQEYLKRMPTPLRELESAPVRQHMFGNPFKIDKRMMVDEADIDALVAGSGSQGTGHGKKKGSGENNKANSNSNLNNGDILATRSQLKRKAGPLPKDFKFVPYKHRRLSSASASPSPSSSPEYSKSPPPSPSPATSPIHTPSYLLNNNNNSDKENDTMNSNSGIHLHSHSPSSFGIGSMSLLSSDEFPSPRADEVDDQRGGLMFYNHNDNNNESNGMDDDDDNDNSIGMHGSIEREPPAHMYPPPPSQNHYSDMTPPISSIRNHVADNTSTKPPSAVPVQNQNHVNHKKIGNINKAKDKKRETSNSRERVKTTKDKISNVDPPPNLVDDEQSSKKNLDLRIDLFKEIRRPILRMDYILAQLSNLYGSYNTRQTFIKGLVREALRFKRKRLAKALEEQAEVLAPFCRPTPS